MLAPKKVKYRKQQKGRMRVSRRAGSTLNFGDFGLQALEPGWVTARQIEAARIAMENRPGYGGSLLPGAEEETFLGGTQASHVISYVCWRGSFR